MENHLLTTDEVAERLRISVKHLWRHVRLGNIRYVEIGLGFKRRRIAFREAHITEFLEKQERLPDWTLKRGLRRARP